MSIILSNYCSAFRTFNFSLIIARVGGGKQVLTILWEGGWGLNSLKQRYRWERREGQFFGRGSGFLQIASTYFTSRLFFDLLHFTSKSQNFTPALFLYSINISACWGMLCHLLLFTYVFSFFYFIISFQKYLIIINNLFKRNNLL